MSAWFRYKYPHIAFAALSSSGVVEAVADYYMYDRHTHDVLMKSGQACVDKTVQVTEYAEKLAAENPKKLFEYFNHEEMEIGEFYYFFADIAAGAVQAGQRVSFCDRLMNESPEDDEGLMQWFADEAARMGVTLDFYDHMELRNEDTSVPSANGRQWVWQTCTHLGYF